MRDTDKAFLGVDIGTSSIAAVVTDADGKVLKTLTVANPSAGEPTRDGRHEQDPDAILKAVNGLVDASEAFVRRTNLKLVEIGWTGQMHGLGQGTVIWVLISEVFPQRFRAQGQALGASTHWVFAALVALFFPIAAEAVPAWSIFAFFGVMMVVHLLWAWFVVPETRGRALEDIA